MKTKKLFLAALATLALAGCVSDDFIGEAVNTAQEANETSVINFGSGSTAFTRVDHSGSDAAGLLGSNFVVEGVKHDGSSPVTVFDDYNVNWATGTAGTTTSNVADWEYVGQTKHAHTSASAQTIKYWDYSKQYYDFIAYSKGTATAVYADGDYVAGTNVVISAINYANKAGSDTNTDGIIDQGAYTIKGQAADLAKCYIADMITAERDNTPTSDYANTVTLKFRSLSAKVRVGLYETVPGYSVRDVVFYTDASTPAVDGKAHLFTTGDDVFNAEGTYAVYYPTTGSTNKTETDYNKAHLAFTPAAVGGTVKDKAFGALTGSLAAANLAAAEDAEAAGNDYLGRASNAAIYAGAKAENYYTVVIPNEAGAALNLKVNYKLVSTDGSSETIDVTGASAKVPANLAAWKSGYAYTYLFKISKDSNGKTNPSVGPEGLYPITFDAVVVETEEGVQETITTVANPSITTYAKGVDVTANNEYTSGATIYTFVDNGTKLTVGTNANLYTVTLASGAAQVIDETSVANALANGTESPTGTWTVTDANGKNMVVVADAGLTAVAQIAATDATDGNAVTIDGAKFTAGASGTIYVFEYIAFKGSVPTVGTDLVTNNYYSLSAGVYTKCASGTADGSTTYYKPDTKHYKIIRIK